MAYDTITLIAFPAPTISIAGDAGVCQGASTELIASPNFTNYLWNDGVQTQNNIVDPGTYWVTATDANGCIASDTTTVVLWPNPQIVFLGDTNICIGQQAYIQANPGYVSYLWSDGVISADNTLEAGFYYLTVTDSLGCQATEFLTVNAAAPTAAIALNTSIALDNSIQWQSTGTTGNFPITSWLWDFGDGNSSNLENPIHTYSQGGNYTVNLIVTDELGCSDTTSYLIAFDPEYAYYVPNTFSPDGDNLNQIFRPIFSTEIDPSNFQMLIFNRWGEIIFESQDPNTGWNGSFGPNGNQCQTGTYTYIITFKDPSTNELLNISGHVILIR
jgi:gliding motility-associated-like protein